MYISQGREVVSQLVHNQLIAGSNPALATETDVVTMSKSLCKIWDITLEVSNNEFSHIVLDGSSMLPMQTHLAVQSPVLPRLYNET